MKYNEQELIRISKLDKIKQIVENYSYNYRLPESNSKELKEKYQSFSKEQLIEKPITSSIVGRVRTMRLQSKAGFINVQDETGNIQMYLREDELSKKDWEIISLVDLGDILYFEGKLMKTKTDELTLRVSSILFITKAISPLPEKYHGLQNIEDIYRKRYLDLIVSEESRNRFKIRSKIISSIRNYLNDHDFIEVETPILHPILGGASAKPFITHHNALDQDLYLRIAPELYLKRLTVGGFNRVYEIGRLFRNEGISIKHNPEFTSLEVYEAFSEYKEGMERIESLLNYVANESIGTNEIEYEGQKISLKAPFIKKEMTDLVKEHTGIDFESITFEEAVKLAKENNVELPKHHTSKGYILNSFFEEKVESKLIQPTFVTGYPVEVSPLAKTRIGAEHLTDRYELFINGREYANGFSELNEPEQQYERFLEQLKEKELGNDESSEMDIDYVKALQYGLPPTSGYGIGIDRLTMLLTNSSSIKDIILFPTLKTKKDEIS